MRFRNGSGTVTVNGRPVDEFFPSKVQVEALLEPLAVTETSESYDIDATIHGGGTTGQAGALRLGIARGLVELDAEHRGALKSAGFLTRDPRRKEQEVRPRRLARRRSTASADRPAGRASRRSCLRSSSADDDAVTLTFGTDGMRGDARTELTPVPVRALARAGGGDPVTVASPSVEIRASGPELADAVHAGVAAAGGDSADLGVVPTPAVARWCADHQVAGR